MKKPITLYDQLAVNNLKTVLLVVLFPLLLMITLVIFNTLAICIIDDKEYTEFGVHILTDIFPIIELYLNKYTIPVFSSIGHLSTFFIPVYVISFIWMLISYNFGNKMMLGFAGAEKISSKDYPKIFNMVENLAITAGLPKPKLYIIDDNSLNAFATGATPKSASVALTKGIIEKLTPLELEGVIAHEIAHIANRDVRLNMLIITGLSIFALMADLIKNAIFRKRYSRKQNAKFTIVMFFIFLALVVFNLVIAPIIHMAISRKREYAADARGALLTRNPLALASALEKISKDSQVEILESSPTMAAACIATPYFYNKASLNSLLSSHPPIKSRIDILRYMAGRL